jgi:hypothetical protein
VVPLLGFLRLEPSQPAESYFSCVRALTEGTQN